MLRRRCAALKATGQPCKAAPLTDGSYCRMHDPDMVEEVAEGRRLGGYRRKREATLFGAYELEELDSLTFPRRVLEVALFDTLAMENDLARARTLGYLVGIWVKVRQEGETEERLRALESAVYGQQVPAESVFDVAPKVSDFSEDEDDTND